MFPRLTLGPNLRMNQTCCAFWGASKSRRFGSMACTISSMRPIRTSPSPRKIPAVPVSRASVMTFQAPARSSASIISTQR